MFLKNTFSKQTQLKSIVPNANEFCVIAYVFTYDKTDE